MLARSPTLRQQYQDSLWEREDRRAALDDDLEARGLVRQPLFPPIKSGRGAWSIDLSDCDTAERFAHLYSGELGYEGSA